MTGIRICGYGGQGIIMTGMIIGKAAAIYDNKYSSLIQAFGPEARGSSCSAQVIISEDKILYPYLTESDIMLAMSQEAYKRFVPELKPSGIILYDNELVTPADLPQGTKTFGIPATRLAEKSLKKIVVNIIIVGFFAAKAGVISAEAAKKAVMDSVPKGTEEINEKAFLMGYEYAG